MNPIEITLKVYPVGIETKYGSGGAPKRSIKFVVVDDDTSQEIQISDTYPEFEVLWTLVRSYEMRRIE